MATEPTQTTEPDNGKSFSDIAQKTKNILSTRNDNGFLTKSQTNSDGALTEKFSLSDTANFTEKMKKLAKIEQTEKYADDIYKPIRMARAL
ncbi:MAG: hypothetical protein LBC64_01850 [Fibromonadaceae bacterium]|jgi:hypothetical protein|nr:hypothetical protein [Fibromonadaceae bacterium]